MRSVPGVSPADQLRLQQMQQEAEKQKSESQETDAGDKQPAADNPPKTGDESVSPAGK